MSKTYEMAEAAHKALEKLIRKQMGIEAESPYGAGVCVRAIGAAEDVFSRVPVVGTALDYARQVYKAIDDLHDDYNDSEGEYTNGPAPIGNVLSRVSDLIREMEN